VRPREVEYDGVRHICYAARAEGCGRRQMDFERLSS